MQTATPTACLSGSLGDDVRTATEAGRGRVEPFENEVLSFDGESGESLEGFAARLAPTFAAVTMPSLPRAVRS